MKIIYSEHFQGMCIFLDKNDETIPNRGRDRAICKHENKKYAEWDGPLGHGWFCSDCGEILQAG